MDAEVAMGECLERMNDDEDRHLALANAGPTQLIGGRRKEAEGGLKAASSELE